MPFFPGERALTMADSQARETRSKTRIAMDLTRSQIPLAPDNFILRVVPTIIWNFIVARALGPVSDGGNTAIHPDTWWVFNPDTETWLSQATFDDEGRIEVGRGPTLQEPEEEPEPSRRKSIYEHMRDNCVEYPPPNEKAVNRG